jgi:uncharacterized protein (DUF427 family)
MLLVRPQRPPRDSILIKVPSQQEELWDCPGNKVHYHREPSAAFSSPNRCLRLCYTPSPYVGVRVRFGGTWIADSGNVLLLFEPGRYPVAYFPETDVSPGTLERTEYATRHHELGATSWYTVRAGKQNAPRGAWQHIDLPAYASELQGRVAFAWPAMDAFYEEDERILGHAADSFHRIDIRQSSRSLVVRHSDRINSCTALCRDRRSGVPQESGRTCRHRHR